jgi:putative DNA primase/helicase
MSAIKYPDSASGASAPSALPVNPDGIPQELKDRPQWVVWRYEERRDPGGAKWTKVPHCAPDRKASSTNAATWMAFAAALTLYQENSFHGIGFVVTSDDPYCGVDADHMTEWGAEELERIRPYLKRLASYTEKTPSGSALRIWVKGKLPGSGRKKGNIEMYDRDRFFTVTGQRLDKSPTTIEERQVELGALYTEVFGPDSEPAKAGTVAVDGQTPDLDDEKLLALAFGARNGEEVRKLWGGDTGGYPSASEADFDLARLLAFWTGPDPDRLAALLRKSKLARDKWDEKHYGDGRTYLEGLVQRALDGRTEFYREGTDTSTVTPPVSGIAGRWTPRLLSTLSTEGQDIPWLWTGYLARGSFSSITGLWKGGKTTLLSHLLKALETGQTFCGQETAPTRVLVITEEGEAAWARRRDDVGLKDHVAIISRPFLGRPTTKEWDLFIRSVAEEVSSQKYDLVVFDALPNLWPVRDENNASEVLNALVPLNALVEAWAAVLIILHPAKAEAAEGKATRGTGAIGGFVDAIIEMRRFDPGHPEDTKRTLRAYSRYDETPAELVIEYTGGGYRVVGNRAQAEAQDRLRIVLEVLPETPPGMTVEEIRENWPTTGIVKPGKRTLERDLAPDRLSGTGIAFTGEGVKGDPRRYYRLSPGPSDSRLDPSSTTPPLRRESNSPVEEVGSSSIFPDIVQDVAKDSIPVALGCESTRRESNMKAGENGDSIPVAWGESIRDDGGANSARTPNVFASGVRANVLTTDAAPLDLFGGEETDEERPPGRADLLAAIRRGVYWLDGAGVGRVEIKGLFRLLEAWAGPEGVPLYRSACRVLAEGGESAFVKHLENLGIARCLDREERLCISEDDLPKE